MQNNTALSSRNIKGETDTETRLRNIKEGLYKLEQSSKDVEEKKEVEKALGLVNSLITECKGNSQETMINNLNDYLSDLAVDPKCTYLTENNFVMVTKEDPVFKSVLAKAFLESANLNDEIEFTKSLRLLNRDSEQGWNVEGYVCDSLSSAITTAEALYKDYKKTLKKHYKDITERECIKSFYKYVPSAGNMIKVKYTSECLYHYYLQAKNTGTTKTGGLLHYEARRIEQSKGLPSQAFATNKFHLHRLLSSLDNGEYFLNNHEHSIAIVVRDSGVTIFDQNQPQYFKRAKKQDLKLISDEIFEIFAKLPEDEHTVMAISKMFKSKDPQIDAQFDYCVKSVREDLLNDENIDGQSLLQKELELAICNGNIQNITKLVEQGAKLDYVNEQQETPFDIAVKTNQQAALGQLKMLHLSHVRSKKDNIIKQRNIPVFS